MFNVALGKSEYDETILWFVFTKSGIIIEEISIQNDVKGGIICRFQEGESNAGSFGKSIDCVQGNLMVDHLMAWITMRY